jgi:hypothetical protein
MHLRYTLNRDKNFTLYHNLPNQLKVNKQLQLFSIIIKEKNIARFYSTSSSVHTINNIFNPFFITGLTDAEGSFICIIRKSAGHKLGWRVEVIFQIGLHKKDLNLLKLIQAYFDGIGFIVTYSNNMCAFRVSSHKQILNKIIPHFDKYFLITKKQADFLLFKKNNNVDGTRRTLKGGRSSINYKYSSFTEFRFIRSIKNSFS